MSNNEMYLMYESYKKIIYANCDDDILILNKSDQTYQMISIYFTLGDIVDCISKEKVIYIEETLKGELIEQLESDDIRTEDNEFIINKIKGVK